MSDDKQKAVTFIGIHAYSELTEIDDNGTPGFRFDIREPQVSDNTFLFRGTKPELPPEQSNAIGVGLKLVILKSIVRRMEEQLAAQNMGVAEAGVKQEPGLN